MKKIVLLLSLIIVVFAGKMSAQSEVKWTFNDKPQEQFFKSRSEFNITMSGLNEAQATAMYTQIKANKDVAACTTPVKNAAGNYDIKLTMVKPQQGQYYAGWARKMGVGVFTVGGKNKKLADASAAR